MKTLRAIQLCFGKNAPWQQIPEESFLSEESAEDKWRVYEAMWGVFKEIGYHGLFYRMVDQDGNVLKRLPNDEEKKRPR